MLSARDIRALLYDAEFQSIPDRNSQMVFLQEFGREKCFVSINSKTLSVVYQMKEALVRKVLSRTRKKIENPEVYRAPPHALSDEREEELIQSIFHEALCLLIVTSDPATKQVFRDEIDEDVNLKIHGLLIPTINDYRRAHEIPNEIAVLLMYNCSAHLNPDTFVCLPRQTLQLSLSRCPRQAIFRCLTWSSLRYSSGPKGGSGKILPRNAWQTMHGECFEHLKPPPPVLQFEVASNMLGSCMKETGIECTPLNSMKQRLVLCPNSRKFGI
jgi:hypothetical protein